MAKRPPAIWQHKYTINPDANVYGFDIETFNDFWCIAFHHYQKQTNPDGSVDFIATPDPNHPQAKSTWMFRSDGLDDGDLLPLNDFISDPIRQANYVFAAWNVTYDLKMLEHLISLKDQSLTPEQVCQSLKHFSDQFISQKDLKSRHPNQDQLDAIDLGWYSEIVPIVTYDVADIYLKKRDANGNTLPATSLKEAAANNGSSILESTIPFDQPHTNASEREEIVRYNHNDVHVMMEIFQRVAKTPYLLKLDFVKALEQKHIQDHPDQAWKPLNAILLRQSEQGLVKKMLAWTGKTKDLPSIKPFFLYQGHQGLLNAIKDPNFPNPEIVSAYKQAINHVFIDKQYLKTHRQYNVANYLVYLLDDQNLMHIQRDLNQLLKPFGVDANFDHQFSTIRKTIKNQFATHNGHYQNALNNPIIVNSFKQLSKLCEKTGNLLPNNSLAISQLHLYYKAFSYFFTPYEHFEITNDDYYGMTLQIKEGGIHASHDGLEIDQPSWSADVASYYPNEIINRKLLNEKLLANYQAILTKRLELKKQKDPIEKIYKLVINKVYGYTGDGASSFYDNQASFSICLNGQFQLLVLVEWLSQAQIVKQWIQMNTDGIQFIPIDESPQTVAIYEQILQKWEHWFNFQLETTKFKYFMNFNVSTYIGITDDHKIKNKGKYYKDVQMDISAPGYTFADLVFQQNIISHLLHNLFVNKQDFLTTFQANQELWKYQNVAKFGNTYQQIFIQHNLDQSQLSLEQQGFDMEMIKSDLKTHHLEHLFAQLKTMQVPIYQTSSIKNHALRGFYTQSGYYMKKFKAQHLVAKPSDLVKNASKQVSAPLTLNPWMAAIKKEPQLVIKHFENINCDFERNHQANKNFNNLMHRYFGLNWQNDLKINDPDYNQVVKQATKKLLSIIQKDLKAAKLLSTTSFVDQSGHKWIALKTGLKLTSTNQKSTISRYFVNFDDPSALIKDHPVQIQYHVHDPQSQNNYYLTINPLKPNQLPKYELVWNGENIGGISDFPCQLYLDQIHNLTLKDVDFQIDYQAYSVLALNALLGLDGFRFDHWLIKHHQALQIDPDLVTRYANGEYQVLNEIVPAIFGFQLANGFQLKEVVPKAAKTKAPLKFNLDQSFELDLETMIPTKKGITL